MNLLLGVKLMLVDCVVFAEVTRRVSLPDPLDVAARLALLRPFCSIFNLIFLMVEVKFTAATTSDAKQSTRDASKHQG